MGAACAQWAPCYMIALDGLGGSSLGTPGEGGGAYWLPEVLTDSRQPTPLTYTNVLAGATASARGA